MLYAAAGEGGFQEIGRIMGMSEHIPNYFLESGIEVGSRDTVAWETLFRLILTACYDMVPKDALKAASHCGGVTPGPYVTAFDGVPAAGEPGNHAYACLCKELIRMYNDKKQMEPDLDAKIPVKLETGFERFFKLTNEETFGDFVEAALGAADAALAVDSFLDGHLADWRRSYSDIVGAGCGRGDRVTPFIDWWINDWVSKGGCGCDNCRRGYGDKKITNPMLLARMPRGPTLMTSSQAAAAAPGAVPANATDASAADASAGGCSEQREEILGTGGACARAGAVQGGCDLPMFDEPRVRRWGTGKGYGTKQRT